MSHQTGSCNRQIQRTRSWIFEALMQLLDEKPYSKIGVSDITQKAGIARQTFYRNYRHKNDIVYEHLMKNFNLELSKTDDGDKQNNVVLIFNFKYMIKNRDNIKKMMSIVEIQHHIQNKAKDFPLTLLEQYKSKLLADEYLIFRYKLHYQITGCLQVFFDWFINDMPLPLDTIISTLNAMSSPKINKYNDIPNIVVRIDNMEKED